MISVYGVPQFSILGTNLFLLFIDSLKLLILSRTKFLYTVDIAILYSGKGLEHLQFKMNNGLVLFHQWMDDTTPRIKRTTCYSAIKS